MGRLLGDYIRNTKGHIAVSFAILSLPLLLMVGLAVDSSGAMSDDNKLQHALDAASLAAVLPGNISLEDREKIAKETFHANYVGQHKIKLNIEAGHEQVDVTGSFKKPTLLMGLIGHDDIEISDTSSAIRTKEDTICVMTLDPSEKGSLRLEKEAFLNAPNCSVQVNSNSSQAIMSTSIKAPVAKSICSAGGSAGNLPSNIKSQCSRVNDPYESIEAPVTTACDYGPINLFSFSSYAEVMVVGEKDRILKPGTYCDGLHIYDSSVTLSPGTYIIYGGPLSIGQNSSVQGEDVTIIFKGNDSVLYTYDEVKVDLKAPATGKYAGLLFFQDRNSSVGETSIIKGGVNMNLLGTMYFPTQNLYVGGVGNMGASSPAMAFIAKNITFTSDIETIVTQNEANILQLKNMLELVIGFGRDLGLTDYTASLNSMSAENSLKTSFETTIFTDHNAAGIPPILPRSDAGARLISTE